MTEERGLKKNAWLVMFIVAILFTLWTLFVMANGTKILPTAFQLAGSTQLVSDIESKALGFMHMSMLKPCWEELWIGVFGIFIAFGLKRGEKYATTLGLYWGIMLVVDAVIQGGYELIVLKWSNACLQSYIFLILGLIALVSMLIVRRGSPETEQG